MCSDWSITWIYNVYKWLFILVFEGMWPLCEFHNGFCCQKAQRCRDFTLIIIWWSWWKKWGQYTGLATFGWGFRQWVQPCHCQEDSQPLTPLLTSQSLTHNRLHTCFTMSYRTWSTKATAIVTRSETVCGSTKYCVYFAWNAEVDGLLFVGTYT